jgi:hypothetical protein
MFRFGYQADWNAAEAFEGLSVAKQWRKENKPGQLDVNHANWAHPRESGSIFWLQGVTDREQRPSTLVKLQCDFVLTCQFLYGQGGCT